ncbi:MAG TPA: tail fiber domain-containing protein [Bryobacteraceae bacterium]|jgi:hypothetical protein|nr:tail fiber domain-containing protein [Bryobacteraceae bacterium]
MMTTVQGTVAYEDGRLANGQVVVSCPAFQANGVAVAASQQAFAIVNGALNLTIYSNVNAQPYGVYYTALYELEEGGLWSEFWIIPNLPSVNLGQIRVGFPATPSVMISALQLTSAGATQGQFLGWNGSHWVPMYVTMINVSPNTIGLTLTANPAADLSVSSSPATLGTSLQLNIPDASGTARGVVTTGVQTFGGSKTFAALATFSAGITVSGTSTIAGYVPTTRLINAGYGLAGGGDLSADRTLSVVDNSNIQKVNVTFNSTLEGTRANLNFIEGPNITLTITDNTGSDAVDVVIQGIGGSGGGGSLPAGSTTGDLLVYDTQPTPGFWTVLPKGAAGDVLTAQANQTAWAAPVPPTPWTMNINAAGYSLQSAGFLGVNAAGPLEKPLTAGRSYVTIKGASDAGILELVQTTADANNIETGSIVWVDANNTAANNILAHIDVQTMGSAANNRGGALLFSTRPDNSTGPVNQLFLDNQGYLGIGAWPDRQLTLTGPGTTSQFKILSPGQTGVTITGFAPGQAVVALGADRVNNQWIALDTQAAILHLQATVGLSFYVASGFTVGQVMSWPAPRMVINNSGYVGINTSTPTCYLNVNGLMRVDNLNANPASGAGLEVYYNPSASWGVIQAYDRTASVYQPVRIEGSAIYLNAASGGRVGIGTTSPTETLTVNGAVKIQGPTTVQAPNELGLDFYSGNSRFLSYGPDVATGGGFQFLGLHSDGSGIIAAMVISAGGNVGIGTSTPNFPLSFGSSINNRKLAVWDGGPGSFYGLGIESNYLHIEAASGQRFYTSAGTILAIDIESNGFVGIGLAGAANPLHIRTQSNCNFLVGAWSNGSDIQCLDNALTTLEPLLINSSFTQTNQLGIGQAPGGYYLSVLGRSLFMGRNDQYSIAFAYSTAQSPNFIGADTAGNTIFWDYSAAQMGYFTAGSHHLVVNGWIACGGWSGAPGWPLTCRTQANANVFIGPVGSGSAIYSINNALTAYLPLTIYASPATFSNDVQVNGNLTLSTLSVSSSISAAGANFTGRVTITNANENYSLALRPNSSANFNWIGVNTSGDIILYNNQVQPMAQFVQGGGLSVGTPGHFPGYAIYVNAGAAYNKGELNWDTTCDIRLKENIRPFTDGLEVLTQLDPIAFEWNGKFNTEAGRRGVGVAGQDAERIIPEWTHRVKGEIDDEPTEIVTLNPSSFTWLAVNAFKQIDERLKKLELRS